MSENNSIKCYNCQTILSFSEGADIGRSEDCPSCRVDLRCCKMCIFYDKSSYNECREPIAERVLEKEKGNFCDLFKAGASGQSAKPKVDLMAQANALFKK